MGWLIDLAQAAIPDPSNTGKSLEGALDHLPPLPSASESRRRKVLAVFARERGHPDLSGVSPECAVSAEDLEDVKAGGLALETVQAFEQAAADTRHLLTPAALAELPPDDATCPRRKISIVGKNALCVNILTQSAWTMADWGAFARRHYDSFTSVIGASAPDVAKEAAEKARRGLPRQSEGREDLANGGAIMTDAANLTDLAAETEDLREFFGKRAGTLLDAGLPRADAELEAARITTVYARNRGYLGASLRAALSGYPVLLAQVPNRPGPVDALPLGLPTVAVQKDKRVLRQGTFPGAHKVKP